MVDMISLLISHGLLVLAAWRLLTRDDLDDETALPADRTDNGAPRGA